MRHAAIAFLTLALIAASCGDSDDTGADDATPSDAPAVDAGAETEAPDPAASGDEPADSVDDEPIELTASWTGVTEEAIRVGVLSIDFEGLAEAGVETSRTNVDQIFAAPLEAINDAGGIHGRRIEIVNEAYLPVGSASADAACARLTEDESVFVVVGSVGNNTECYTELNETAVIAVSQMTAERLANARAPYATVQRASDERIAAGIRALADLGIFDGETIGLGGAVDASEERYAWAKEALRAEGIEVIDGLVGENAGDVTASQSEGEVIQQLFETEGVTVAINTTGIAAGLVNAASNPDGPQLVLLPIVGARDLLAGGLDLAAFDGALSVVDTAVRTSEQPDLADDPLVAECVAEIESRTGETIGFSLDDDTSLNGAINGCSIAIILEEALLNAGPELTHDTFQAGLEAIGEFSLPGYELSQLGPGDMDASNTLTVVEFDADEAVWVPVESVVG